MNFINEIAPHAQRVYKQFTILASFIIAQAIHESNWGKSGLAVNGKNLFGVKGSYNGQSITMKTWEVYNGKNVMVDAAFRKYPSWYESLEDLAKLYLNGVSWDRNKYKAVVGESDYKKVCRAVQSAGYATDPEYANKLIRTIEAYNLTQYDVVEEETKPVTATQKESNEEYLYVVKAGDTLGEIAKSKGVTVDYLVKLNNIQDKNRIYVGQRIKLKGKVSEASSAAKHHKVVKGDTVSALALKYGSSSKQIKEWNKLNDEYLIRIDQTLRVK